MNVKYVLFLAFFQFLVSAIQTHGQLALERDINTGPASSDPADFVILEDYFYFRADDGLHGAELYRYNIPQGIAELAADIRPYDASSSPIHITPLNGKIYFSAIDVGSTPYLMEYDPEDGSVVRFRDSNNQLIPRPSNLHAFNGQLFFSMEFSGFGREPARLDPITKELVMLADINPTGNSTPFTFTEIDGKLWFWATSATPLYSLWYYDPEDESVTQIDFGEIDLTPNVNFLFHYDGRIYFRGGVPGQGHELRIYDIDSDALVETPEIFPGSAGSDPGPFVEYDGKVFFPATSPGSGREVMYLDPADNSITLLHDIYPGGSSNPGILAVLDDKLYITAGNGETDERQLYSYSTTNGFEQIAELENNGEANFLNILITSDEKLYLYGYSPDYGTELFSYTPGNDFIELAADINQTTIGSYPFQFTQYNNRLYFSAEEPNKGRETWVYNPSTGQTNILENAPGNSNPWGYTVLDNKLFYAGSYPELGYGIYYFDDITGDITPTSYITPGQTGHIAEMIAFNNKLYFTAMDSEVGNELFVYEPQTDEFSLVADINPGGSSNPSSLFIFDNKIFFAADDGIVGKELWYYNPETDEVHLAADILEGDEWGTPDWFVEYDNELYFSAFSSDFTMQLFSYNPISGVVTQRSQITGNLGPEYLTVYQDKLFFKGRYPGVNVQLLYYDAAEDELVLAAHINTSTASNPEWLTVFDDNLYFAATTAEFGTELWAYNEEDGATIIADIRSGVPGSDPSWLTVFNDKLYFSANDGFTGQEIWSLASCINLFVDTEPAYYPDNTGSIFLTVEGGTPPYQFLWSNGASTQNLIDVPVGIYTVRVNDATGCIVKLTAEIIQIIESFELTLVSEPENGGELSGAGTYNIDEEVSISATANDGYLFLHWSLNDEIISEEPEFIYIMPDEPVTLTAHFQTLSSEADILEFSLEQQTGPAVIDPDAATVDIEVETGTDVTALVPTLAISEHASIDPDHSGQTVDYTEPVEYLITAEDGTQKTWTVAVSVAPNNDATLSEITIDGEPLEDFDPETLDYTVMLAYDTEVAPQIGASTTDPNAIAEITPANELPGQASILVTAEDGENQLEYTLAFQLEDAPLYSLELLAEPLEGGTVSGSGEYPEGEVVSVSATPNEGSEFLHWRIDEEIISNEPQFDFTMPAHPVTLVAYFHILSSEADILEFSLEQQTGPALIDSDAATVDIEVETGTDVTALVPTIAISEHASIDPDHNGLTVDYTQPVEYLITAEDGTQKTWTVAVSVAPNNDATLSEITIDGEPLEDFDPEILDYTVILAYDTEEAPQIGVTLADPNASVVITQADQLPGEASAMVTAEDGNTQLEYTVSFQFEEIPLFSLELLVEPQEAGSASGGGEYAEGEVVNIGATSNEGYEFLHWSLDDEIISSESQFNFTMPAEPVSLIALFRVLSSEADIVEFTLVEQTGPAIIDHDAASVNIEVEPGTDVTVLVPTLAISENATIDPDHNGQTVDYSLPAQYLVTAENGTQKIWTVTVDIATRINSAMTEFNPIRIYPNPARDYIRIDFQQDVEVFTFSVFDLTGKKVITGEGIGKKRSIAISDLEQGLYFLNIKIAENIYYQRFQIIR